MDIFESLENLNVSEECFNEIVGLVEEVINELNKYEQYKVDNNPKLKKEIGSRQAALKQIGDMRKREGNSYLSSRAVDLLADENRDALGRDEDSRGIRISKVSYTSPERHAKGDTSYSGQKAIRTEQSQRGSTKDLWNRNDPLTDKMRKAKEKQG